jgi:hypothetical protein
MSDPERAGASESELTGAGDSSRRGFLILAGASAAAVGAVTLAPTASAAPDESPGAKGSVEGPLVAYVSDLRRGNVSVMMGEREVVVHDPALCASLARVLG